MQSIPTLSKNSQILLYLVPYFTTMVGLISIPDNEIRTTYACLWTTKNTDQLLCNRPRQNPSSLRWRGWVERRVSLCILSCVLVLSLILVTHHRRTRYHSAFRRGAYRPCPDVFHDKCGIHRLVFILIPPKPRVRVRAFRSSWPCWPCAP